MAAIMNAIGIMMATIGTVFTLWTIIHINPQSAGTWDEQESRHEEFPREQMKAKIGCGLIIFGGILQLIGQFI